MTTFAKLEFESHPAAAVREFLSGILSENIADGILVASATPYSPLPMPTLFSDSSQMEAVDPLAPVSPFNASRQAASLLRHDTGKRLVLVLRPCEIRAFVELAKLNQCVADKAVIIGIECLGRMENNIFLEQLEKHADLTGEFLGNPVLQELICESCRTCENFQPEGADLTLRMPSDRETDFIGILAETRNGEEIFERLGLKPMEEPHSHGKRVEELRAARISERRKRLSETSKKINSIEKLQTLLSNCLNCYNCRVACPVCYCRECVFLTDVFSHDPEVFIRRAQKKGRVKMPTETTMFHMTRLAH
ncbi:MAG: formate dehydrogenase, partial [Proteobacteria bacterium]|nr:formate dehydrogenase [Pseudomonadota bacterium]